MGEMGRRMGPKRHFCHSHHPYWEGVVWSNVRYDKTSQFERFFELFGVPMNQSDLDRIEELRRGGIKDRLARGAGILADLWRRGIRCGNGWRKDCVCPAKNEFCAAKNKWVGLLAEHHAGIPTS
jgi:hypothetical protein